MKKITIEELEKIREDYKKVLEARKGGTEDKIIVHMGTCGIAAGAREVMAAVLEELGRKDAPQITVMQSSCIGLCDREPVVTVIRKGETPVRYYHMTPEKIKRVFREHIIGGKIVSEFTK